MTCSPRAGDESDAAVRLQRNPSVELTFFRRLADTDDDRGLTLANVSLHTTQVSPAQGPSTDDESIPLDTELRLGQRPILSSTGRQHQKGHPTEQNSFLNGFRVNSNNYHGYSKETRVQSTTRPSPSPKGGRELYRPSDVRNVTDIKTSFSSSEPFLPFLDTAKPPRDWARTLSISWGIGFFFFLFFFCSTSEPQLQLRGFRHTSVCFNCLGIRHPVSCPPPTSASTQKGKFFIRD